MPSAPQPLQSKPGPPVDQARLAMEHKKGLLEKVKLLRERNMNRGADLTNCNPAKVYMWVNIKEDRQHFFQAWGYTLVRGDTPTSPYKQPDGTHKRADVILYEIDREMYEAIQADNQLRGIEGIEGHKQAAIGAMNRMGVREYEPRV